MSPRRSLVVERPRTLVRVTRQGPRLIRERIRTLVLAPARGLSGAKGDKGNDGDQGAPGPPFDPSGLALDGGFF